jgi:hypothetical protein
MATYICDCWNEYSHILSKEDRLNEFKEAEGCRIEAFESEVFLLESRTVVWNTDTKISSFGTEEEVRDKLYGVDL